MDFTTHTKRVVQVVSWAQPQSRASLELSLSSSRSRNHYCSDVGFHQTIWIKFVILEVHDHDLAGKLILMAAKFPYL
jgi:hypothetical protein